MIKICKFKSKRTLIIKFSDILTISYKTNEKAFNINLHFSKNYIDNLKENNEIIFKKKNLVIIKTYFQTFILKKIKNTYFLIIKEFNSLQQDKENYIKDINFNEYKNLDLDVNMFIVKVLNHKLSLDSYLDLYNNLFFKNYNI